ncbi:hypothetical protein AWC15_06775 [Mycobacterium lacus]|uniref:Uncharacterized protein n=1 Tax=Mycobacterium lacus TaxID=169765 RepID=A0A1X1XTV2_9MYCO|nr:hypothetical protein [Mycobacterium lacus]MCV7125188.1 hypothetical protein [Mycobacterium lacus]ORW02267.1 hypothetical protein AWC15_06775 [Mycobacterium lacus]BBX98899.1 hypothetical protein MLAC_41930 [Mycobacterium lacus]
MPLRDAVLAAPVDGESSGYDLAKGFNAAVANDVRAEQECLAKAERVGPYLTLLRGISVEQANIRWAEQALTTIERRYPRRT